jgi:hypothetical protein
MLTLDEFMMQALAKFLKDAVRTGRWSKQTSRQWALDRFDGYLNVKEYEGLTERTVLHIDHYALNEFLEGEFTEMEHETQVMAKPALVLAGLSDSFVVWKMYHPFDDDDMTCLYGVFASETDGGIRGVPMTLLGSMTAYLVSQGVFVPKGEWSDEAD